MSAGSQSEGSSVQSLIDAWLDACERATAPSPAVAANKDTATLSYTNDAGERVRVTVNNPTDAATAIVWARAHSVFTRFPKLMSNARYFLTAKGGVNTGIFEPVSKRASGKNGASDTPRTPRTPRTPSDKNGPKVPKELAVARAEHKSLEDKIAGIKRAYAELPMLEQTLHASAHTLANLEKQYADKAASDKAAREKADADKIAKEAATLEAALKAIEKAEAAERKAAERKAALLKRAEELRSKAASIPVANPSGQPVVGQTV